MSILQGATGVAILGGQYIAAAAGSNVTVNHGDVAGVSSAFKDLSAAAAHTALPDSAARFNAPRCHRNTRTKYLIKFEKWMLGEGEGEGNELYGKTLIWLNGGAGAGKSAIMQSIVERRACHAVILGAFFFSRADTSRNCIEVLIPTLAFQMARLFPAAMSVLAPIILGDPLIFKASPHIQAYQLLVRPILYLIETGIIDTTRAARSVFVIDGLDECSNPPKQALIIRIIASILCDHRVPISFLIASRSELAITHAFQRENQLFSVFASISLDGDEDAQSDIRQFIEDSFLDILDSHPWGMHIKPPWPCASSIDNLVWKSSGHFIYAATALKFIASCDEQPRRALQVVEGILPSRTENPFSELDALYTHILTHARYSEQVLSILKHCYLTGMSQSVAAVCYVHGIPTDDLILFLSDVRPLISVSPDEMAELTIIPKHSSLYDFLVCKERSGALYIDKGEYHPSMLARYFQLLDNGIWAPGSSFCIENSADWLIEALAEAINNSRDRDLCLFLIKRHSSYDIWNFHVESAAQGTSWSSRYFIATSLYNYMCAVRKFLLDTQDKALFFDQFKLYINLLLDDLSDFVHKKPQYRIIPAILFSSSRSGLDWTYSLLDRWGRQFRIDWSYHCIFYDYLMEPWTTGSERDLTSEAIGRLPQNRVSWGSDLAILMKLVLDQLVGLSKRSNMPYTSPHRRWLRQQKPLNQMALGFPRLSSTLFFNLYRRAHPHKHFVKLRYGIIDAAPSDSISVRWNGQEIYDRKFKCLTLLKAVIFYLHKSDCTLEIAKLARRSLPMAAQWYPKLMKRVRAEMDAYVRRWEDSSNRCLDKEGPMS